MELGNLKSNEVRFSIYPKKAQIEVFGYFLIEHEVSAHFLEFASIDVSDLA